MELKLYIKIIRKNLLLIVATTALLAVVAYFIGAKAQSGYKLEQTFFIADANLPATSSAQATAPQYDFDRFYDQEKARNFTDTAVAILQNADFDNSLSIQNARLSAQKLSPQLIKIMVVSASDQDAKFILDRVALEFNQKIKSFVPQSPLEIKPVGLPAEPVLNRISARITVLAGIVFGLAISTFLVAIKTYFKL